LSLDATLLELAFLIMVNVIKVASNGDIMVGGSFSKKYNGTDVNRLVLLDSIIVPGFDRLDLQVLQFIHFREFSRWLMVCRWFFSIFESQNQGRLAKLMQMVY
jgi:hypothetical protein